MKNNLESVKFDSNPISIADFMNTKYREYWEYSNKDGKNAVDAYEQLPEVVRKIIFASYKNNLKLGQETKTVKLSGTVSTYHPHGDASIQESIKGVASDYKSQVATRLLHGLGNFGDSADSTGAAARYTSVTITPLMNKIFKDIPFVPFDREDPELEQPKYISCPLPMALINGVSAIGTGKSCYIAERNAKEVIEWIDVLRKNDWNQEKAEKYPGGEEPSPMSVTGCKTWFEPSNGYIYYKAIVHEGVNMNDIDKKGKYDVITNLPPKSTASNVIAKLQAKLPSRITNRIIDGSGEGRPTWIIVPTGYLDEKDYTKYSMQNARKEQFYIWDHEYHTMRKGSLLNIAKEWFEDRGRVVTKRINEQIRAYKANNHKFDLIKIFAENKMQEWNIEKVEEFFVNLAKENDFHGFEIDEDYNPVNLTCEEAGLKDASLVLSLSVRTFLPDNIEKNKILREKNESEIKNLKNKIENIGDTIISEAKEIIEAQEKFFANLND